MTCNKDQRPDPHAGCCDYMVAIQPNTFFKDHFYGICAHSGRGEMGTTQRSKRNSHQDMEIKAEVTCDSPAQACTVFTLYSFFSTFLIT